MMPSHQIFCYHKITNRPDFGICTRTLKDFHRDINWISSLPIESRPAVSFDDGYHDTFTNAFPILSEFGLTASVFVTSDFIGKSNSWDANFFGSFKHISKSEMKLLTDANWTIGSHGTSHLALTELSEKSLRNELVDSKKIIEDIIGKAVGRISFPFGRFNQRVIEIAQEVGYTSALSLSRTSADGFVQRGKAVYRFDTEKELRSKLIESNFELTRLNMINSFSGLTILMHRMKGLNS